MSKKRGKGSPPQLKAVYTRLFAEDVELLRAMAAERGMPWQIELRSLVHRALKGEQREIVMLKEQS